MIVVAILSQIRSLSAGLLKAYTGERLVLRFRSQIFRHVQRLSFSYHDRLGTSDSTYRIQFDANSIQNVFLNTAIPLITASFTLVLFILATNYIDSQLTWIALIAAPVLIVLVRLFGVPLKKRWRKVSKLDSASMSVVQEALSALRVVKAFGKEDEEHDRFLDHANRKVKGQIEAVTAQAVFGGLTGLTLTVALASVLFIGALHVQQGLLSIGELTLVMAYIGQIFAPLRKMTQGSAALAKSLVKAERVFSVLDHELEVKDRPDAQTMKRCSGALEFRKVFFSYREDLSVLNEVSFAVEPGSRVGIRGKTGAGKTTLAALMMRFYDPDAGQILLDGIDLRDIRLEDLRNQFAMVLQEPVLFSATLSENISYAKTGATEEEVIHAAKLANAHEFISALPDGYDTEVGERGMMLSGGERQRIALARAFLKDAPILILDEPTSSVDTKTELVIMEAMERLMKGRTTFMIAHRLSTLDHCDLQVEIANGRLQVLPTTKVSSG
jgi:ATP-binding cassette subfamily B protein